MAENLAAPAIGTFIMEHAVNKRWFALGLGHGMFFGRLEAASYKIRCRMLLTKYFYALLVRISVDSGSSFFMLCCKFITFA